MKFLQRPALIHIVMSHPARGAWVEMRWTNCWRQSETCRTPQGVRGLKFFVDEAGLEWDNSRTPQGVRGLKSEGPADDGAGRRSHPARGAWIEILSIALASIAAGSHPARGAWVEIRTLWGTRTHTVVAPRKGCVG